MKGLSANYTALQVHGIFMALKPASIWSPKLRTYEPEMGARETSPRSSRGKTSSSSEGDTGHRWQPPGECPLELCEAAQPQGGTSKKDYYSPQNSL